MTQYTVEEVTRREDLDGIVDVIWAAMDGINSSHQVFFPTLGSKPADREAAIQSSKDRTWEDHKSSPSSHWIFARDNMSGDIVGGCQWRIYTENPFPNGAPHIEAEWWPVGERRRFASEVIMQCFTPRTKWMACPHVGELIWISRKYSEALIIVLPGLSFMCVCPRYQRRGIGRLLMEWGLAKTDVLELESFIKASEFGKGLYTKYGFQTVKDVSVKMDVAKSSEEWKRLSEELLPIDFTALWRPSKGEWKDGESQMTWDKRLKATQG